MQQFMKGKIITRHPSIIYFHKKKFICQVEFLFPNRGKSQIRPFLIVWRIGVGLLDVLQVKDILNGQYL